MIDLKVVMFSKKHNPFCDYAESILKSYFPANEYLSVRGDVGEHLNEELRWYDPEYIISFLSPWIIPRSLLQIAKTASINFHPGSPDYPGTGCYNFALYECPEKYGVTVHHMQEQVDTGEIIMTSYFDLTPFDTVESLKIKSMNHLLYLFNSVLSIIAGGGTLPKSSESWSRKPFTRKDMIQLFEIDPQNHDKAEVEKRIRAAQYPGRDGAFVTLFDNKFYYPYDKDAKPLA